MWFYWNFLICFNGKSEAEITPGLPASTPVPVGNLFSRLESRLKSNFQVQRRAFLRTFLFSSATRQSDKLHAWLWWFSRHFFKLSNLSRPKPKRSRQIDPYGSRALPLEQRIISHCLVKEEIALLFTTENFVDGQLKWIREEVGAERLASIYKSMRMEPARTHSFQMRIAQFSPNCPSKCNNVSA